MNPVAKISRLFTKIFGSGNDRAVKGYMARVARINELEPEVKKLSDEKLAGKTAEFRDRLAHGEKLDALLPEAFAVVREASFRNLRTAGGVPMRHFDVQLLGGMVLHEGKVAEMATGEGKTLVATLPSYLNGLESKGVHVVTVNDYLAQRDRDWMSVVFESLEMTSGAIHGGMEHAERKEQYARDITYGTNNEFGFDYLRDNMKTHLDDQVQQRGRHFAIVDEVDSILIDEARTPLIISGPARTSTDRYYIANRVAKRLQRGRHFEIKEKERDAYLSTEEGIEQAQKLVGVESFYDGKNMEWPHLIQQALRAHHVYQRDVEYVVRDGEVVIVDEFTGRLMEGRTWSDGLHQAVEAKENLKIRQENQTLATITLQNYFKLYSKLAGMTGTALTEAGEFFSIYKLDVVAVPTNRPVLRNDFPDSIYRTAKEKYYAIVEEIQEINAQERPILVGTTSIERSELLSGMLTRRGIKHDVLNAKNHQREAEIVLNAGQPGRVTIATNMAGRGTDIVLGEGVKEKGGLHVLATERHEARRIDNQLRGRCARQGDPGSSKFFLSLEDDLMRRFASERVSSILKKLGMQEGDEISHPWVTKAIQRAQKKVENYHFEIRKSLVEYDGVMNEQRLLVYEQRQSVLEGKDLRDTVHSMAERTIERQVNQAFDATPEVLPGDDAVQEYNAVDEIRTRMERLFGIEIASDSELGLQPKEDPANRRDVIIDRLVERYRETYDEREKDNGAEGMAVVNRFVVLSLTDDKWKDHLLAMDHLRHSIGLRGYGQEDPKIKYKQEGYQMFSEMLDLLYEEVSQMVLKLRVRKEDEEELGTDLQNAEFRHDALPVEAQAAAERNEAAQQAGDQASAGPIKPIVNKGPKVGRNDPCTCGSGKKYKKCCGAGA